LLESNEAFRQPRTAALARNLAYGALTCLGRHTVTGIITAAGQQFVDWTSAYRLFAQKRINTDKLFNVALQGVLKEIPSDDEIIAHMDDTLLRKTGRKIIGSAWRRDPLGPPFHTNFVWGQRFLQISMALPDNSYCSQSRAIPVDFHHCPTPKKPGKQAEKQEWDAYKQEQKRTNLSKQGSERIKILRQQIDQSGAKDREMLISVDGSYTNNTVLKSLPVGVTLIGRTRKDTKLYTIPDTSTGVGRNRVYGDRIPTPEQIRQSDQYPWQSVQAWAAGKTHSFDIKIVRDLRWRAAGSKHDLQLVIIRPLGYRLTKKSRMLYRQPAYLICTDPGLSIEKLLQAYLWRWEIEVNFRDEKTLLGCGEAQVRTKNTVEKIPAFIVALYAFLHLASHRATRKGNKKSLPRPVWYPAKNQQRPTSGDLINLLRTQLWAKALGGNFSGFVNQQTRIKNYKNKTNALTSALFYLRK
jgi:hypothetical protein